MITDKNKRNSSPTEGAKNLEKSNEKQDVRLRQRCPFFFRAVSLVSIAALISAPIIFLALFIGKVISKIFGIYPVVGIFRKKQKENQKKKVAKLMAEGMDEE